MAGAVVGALAILVAYLLAFFPAVPASVSPWLMAGGVTLLLTSLLLLGARRRGRRAPIPLVFAIVSVGLLILACFGAALLLPAETPNATLLLGLPRRAALLVYGVGILPFLVLPVAYALSFEATVLSEAELSELRGRLAEPPGEEVRR